MTTAAPALLTNISPRSSARSSASNLLLGQGPTCVTHLLPLACLCVLSVVVAAIAYTYARA
eukprot:3358479-Prymnesium_polylepis.1